MDIGFTNHGQQRQQQRAIPGLVVSLIHSEGSVSHSHDGSEIRFIDKAARKRIRRAVGGDRAYAMLERWFDKTYLVAADGSVITTGHLTCRIRRR
jgi:hypothetical protein